MKENPKTLAALSMLCAVWVAAPISVAAQVGRYYVEAIGDPTLIYSEPTPSSEVLQEISAKDQAVMESVDEILTSTGVFHKIEPLPGWKVAWDFGYVHEDQIRAGYRRPRQYTAALYVSRSTSRAESVALEIDGTNVPEAFGREGTFSALGLGFHLGSGKHIPVGGAAPWFKFGFEFSVIDPSEAELFMLLAWLGGDLTYKASGHVDLSLAVEPGVALVSRDLRDVIGRDWTLESWSGVVDILVGMGYVFPRRSFKLHSFSGFRFAIQGGYRLAWLGDWNLREGSGSNAGRSKIELSESIEPLSLNGPIVRMVVGY